MRSAAPCRHGVLAFGDSITNGGGELQWGVALQSWALWTARGLGLPFTTYAVDGATVAEVLREQWPDFRARSADPDARYDVACLYAGVNDVRRSDWDAGRFAERFAEALGLVAGHADRTLICTLPRDLGRPRAGAKVEEANAAIERAARAAGALVVDLRDFGARNHVMVDHVHPTAFGQVAIAERALDVLAADGLAPRVRPHTLLRYETTPWRRLRGDATYAYRHAKGSARAAWVLARARRG